MNAFGADGPARPVALAILHSKCKIAGSGTSKTAAPGYVVHPGDTRLPLATKVTALPFGEL